MREGEDIVFVVDDDAAVRRSLERLIRSVGLEVRTCSSAQEFLQSLYCAPPAGAACLVLDVRMPGLSGLDLQTELAATRLAMPIIFITGYGTIPMSVRAMKAGAVDFLIKPFDEQDLLNAVRRALDRDRQDRREQAEIVAIQERLARLTPRERDVLALVVTGLLNKQIAGKLGTSEKTIKVHRARVMQKMQAASVVELVRLVERAGLPVARD